MKKNTYKLFGALSAASFTFYMLNKVRTNAAKKAETDKLNDLLIASRDYKDKKVYLIGGGLANLAAAVFLVRDAGFNGKNVYVLEGLSKAGGSNDGGEADHTEGFVCRGGRMLNEETFENFWDLFGSIPSLDMPGMSVTEEILNFDHLHPTHAQARLVDHEHNIVNTHTMGFDNEDRVSLSKLLLMDEKALDDLTIQDWFGAHFFETNFWQMWQTTFAFQPWSSLFEFRRYMNRMMLEFINIDTLKGVTRTPYNQYESLIEPLLDYLQKESVNFIYDTVVKDIEFKENTDQITALALHTNHETIRLRDGDVAIMSCGSITDSSCMGSFTKAPKLDKTPPISADLWRSIASKKEGFGNPDPFFTHEDETNWESFTVTCRGNKLLKRIERFSGNIPGSGALMTLKDSPWLLNTVVAAQPHFRAQDTNTTVFWGYGFKTANIGEFVKKKMSECTGEEILYEWVFQMGWGEDWEEIKSDIINVIPCYMPYIDALFQPHKLTDRPLVVPNGSTNFALVGQFCHQELDMVFTEEYSVRAARSAVYTLFDVPKEVIPVTEHNRNPKVLIQALHAMFR
jgi:oleate hydratase